MLPDFKIHNRKQELENNWEVTCQHEIGKNDFKMYIEQNLQLTCLNYFHSSLELSNDQFWV